jgi:AraC-type transcriptional regulator
MSKVSTASTAPEYSLTEPLVVVMAQGGKRLLLGEQVHEYRAGQCLAVTANLPVTGHYIDITDGSTSLAMALVLRPAVVAELVLEARR